MSLTSASTTSVSPVRLAIVDDHILFRKGLIALLDGAAGIEVVCEAANGQEFLEMLDRGIGPDVALMDMEMPVLDGLQTTRLLRTQFPKVRVIILSMYDDPTLIRTVLAEGAHSYLMKNTSPEAVRGAVMAAARR